MRLLKFGVSPDIRRLEITFCEYFGEDIPPYAILSHRWGPTDEEVSYYDFTVQRYLAVQKKGYQKIEYCCDQALQDGLTHAWIDTCCIDKNSSADLSEAINTMFDWYQKSHVCYAYLSDVPNPKVDDYRRPGSSFRSSQWFKRGWTLQELVAPNNLIFFAADWAQIGQKYYMSETLLEITNIPKEVLLRPSETLHNACASQKMSWASGRRTTRIEDRAYSLIGLFGVSLPILYGEGHRAFRRLQEEIIRQSFDQSIFAWHLDKNYGSLLAESPDAFARSGNVRAMTLKESDAIFKLESIYPSSMMAASLPDYSMTNIGLHIRLPRRGLQSHKSLQIAFLACFYEGKENPIFIYLRRYTDGLSEHFFRTRRSSGSLGDGLEISTLYEKHFYAMESKLWIANLDHNWIKTVRPLIPDDVARQKATENSNFSAYHIRLFFQGHVKMVYPMADVMKSNEITIETLATNAWFVSIRLRKDCEVNLVLAVISNELMIHLEVGRNPHARSSGEEMMERFKSRAVFPCVRAKLRSGAGNTQNVSGVIGVEDEMVDVCQESFHHLRFKKKVFSLWLRVGQRKDLEALEGPSNMAVPLPWTYSLADLLSSCDPACDSNLKNINEYSSYNSSSLETDFVSDHVSDQGPGYSLGFGQGTAMGSMAAQDDAQSKTGMDWSNLAHTGHASVVNTMAAGQYMSRRVSDDSHSFNIGYVTAYKAARKQAYAKCQDKQVEYGHAEAYPLAYTSSYANGYATTHESSYAGVHGTPVPQWVRDCVNTYVNGYCVGYQAGYASGDACGGGAGHAFSALSKTSGSVNSGTFSGAMSNLHPAAVTQKLGRKYMEHLFDGKKDGLVGTALEYAIERASR